MDLTCHYCAKIIKGTVTHLFPSKLHIQLGIAVKKSYHPRCYEIAEKAINETRQDKYIIKAMGKEDFENSGLDSGYVVLDHRLRNTQQIVIEDVHISAKAKDE